MSSPRVLVIGGGLAGLFCALKLAPSPVTLLAAAPLGFGASSVWAQGGVAAALADDDSAESHAADTVAAGAGLVDAAAALDLAREARAGIDDLLGFGVPFDRDAEGRLIQSREAAHSHRRIARVGGDGAGAAIMRALVETVRRTPSIRVEVGAALDLVTVGHRVCGARARRPDGRIEILAADASVLATGGIGHLYAVTTNPVEAGGAGLAMAARAGAMIADAEFVQFHPTAIDIGRDPAPLATEALRGDGATLVDGRGRRFMPALHPDAELAPRDVVARGVFAEVLAGRGAFLDTRAVLGASIAAKFPTVAQTCRSAGIDPVAEPIPVVPAAHYHMGGVWTDRHGRTSLAGLWAAGEVASTGVHGANRLASNSLLEAVIFGARVAADVQARAVAGQAPPSAVQAQGPASEPEGADAALETALRQLMSRHVGVIREGDGLVHALAELAAIETQASGARVRNMAVAGLLVAAAALQRRESRGAHWRSDYPASDPALARRMRMRLADARGIARAVALVPAA